MLSGRLGSGVSERVKWGVNPWAWLCHSNRGKPIVAIGFAIPFYKQQPPSRAFYCGWPPFQARSLWTRLSRPRGPPAATCAATRGSPRAPSSLRTCWWQRGGPAPAWRRTMGQGAAGSPPCTPTAPTAWAAVRVACVLAVACLKTSKCLRFWAGFGVAPFGSDVSEDMSVI